MPYSNEHIEEKLIDLLDELLSRGNQDGSIIDLKYDKEKQQCTVTLTVHIEEADDYIGFQVY